MNEVSLGVVRDDLQRQLLVTGASKVKIRIKSGNYEMTVSLKRLTEVKEDEEEDEEHINKNP